MGISGVDILFAKNDLLVMAKPAGLTTSGPMNTPGPEVHEILQYNRAGFIAHRIDRFTSGLLLGASSSKMREYLMRNWHQITKKFYLAVIKSPVWDAITVFSLIDGKTATTTITVLERQGKYALVQCELVRNGRTHQIRKHLQSVGYPIVGDRVYGGKRIDHRRGQLLHAWRMSVRLPGQPAEIEDWSHFQARIPNDFKKFGTFDWRRWDEGATERIGVLAVPTDWQRPPRPRM